MRKFLLFSLPLLVLVMAIFRSLLAAAGRTPELLRLAGAGLPAWVLVGTWLLEALGLSALFLLIQGGGGNRLLNGLLTGWIAWVFRGPLLVVAVVTLGGLPAAPWWSMAISWWFLYTVCGLLLGAIAAAAAYPPPAGAGLTRAEQARAEPARVEQPRAAEPRVEQPRAEEIRVEQPRVEAAAPLEATAPPAAQSSAPPPPLPHP